MDGIASSHSPLNDSGSKINSLIRSELASPWSGWGVERTNVQYLYHSAIVPKHLTI